MTDVDRARGIGGRGAVAFAALALIGLAALALAFFSYRSTAAGRDADQDRTITQLADRADANARDGQALAEQLRDLGVPPVVEPAKPGERGNDGRDGADGVDGRDGTDGLPGSDGADGEPGADGADGQSPPCLSESAQCRGTDGQPGADGAGGQPPAGWTWIDTDGRTQFCARDAGSPDSAPTYTCSAEPPAETVPGGPPLPLTTGG